MTVTTFRSSVIPFIGFFVFYLLLLSNNLSITHDSINYLLQVTSLEFLFHSNHLIYQPALVVVVSTLSSMGFEVDSRIVIEVVSAVAGALTLQAAYLIMVKRLGLSVFITWMALGACGFSFGIWYYSVAIEIYTLPLCFLAWTFYLLMDEAITSKSVFIAAVLHSIAILFHETAIFFALVPLLALLSLGERKLSSRIYLLGIYVLTGTIIVSTAYLLAAASTGHIDSIDQFLHWFMGGGGEQYWSPVSPTALVLAAVGFGRAIIGAHFMFGIPKLQEVFQQIFSGKSLDDEIYFVQNLSIATTVTLCVIAVMTLALILFMVAIAVKNLFQGNFISPKRGVILLLAWFLPYTLFFIAWDPSNVDLWIPQVAVFWILLAALLTDKDEKKKSGAYLLLVCSLSLLLVNGVGSVFQAKSKELDYNWVKVNQLNEQLKPGDYLYIGDSWPISDHIKYYTDIEFTAVADLYNNASVDELVEEMSDRISRQQKIYLTSDVFTSHHASKEHYGPSYIGYLERLQARFCGMKEVDFGGELELVELSCIR